jgi:ATP-dependent protease ClpP protease subunit
LPDKIEEQKPSPLAEGLMNRRTVTLAGEINDQSISDVGQRLLTLQMRSADPINLVIDSGGGNMDAAFRLCDLITHVLTAPVHGIALGACGSAATFVMLCCTKRAATPYSRFLVHSGTRNNVSFPINQESSKNIEQLLKDVKTVEDMVLRFYTKKLTAKSWTADQPDEAIKRAFVQKLIDRGDQRFGKWLTAEEAIEVGLIETIIYEKLEIFGEKK